MRAIESTIFLGPSGIVTSKISIVRQPAQITTFRNISSTGIQSSFVLEAQNQSLSTPAPFFDNVLVRDSAGNVLRHGFQGAENGLFALKENVLSGNNNVSNTGSSGGQGGSMAGTSGGSVSTEISSLLTSIDRRTTFSNLKTGSNATAPVTTVAPTSSGIHFTGTTMTSGASSSFSTI